MIEGRERIEAEIDRVACREAQQGGRRYGGSVLQLENRIEVVDESDDAAARRVGTRQRHRGVGDADTPVKLLPAPSCSKPPPSTSNPPVPVSVSAWVL